MTLMTSTYKGYIGQIDGFDEEDDLFYGRVTGLRDVITFQGRSVKELHKAFVDAVDDYREFCAERGEAPEKPFSGKFVLRVPPEVHRSIAIAAGRERKSLNVWAKEALERAAKAAV